MRPSSPTKASEPVQCDRQHRCHPTRLPKSILSWLLGGLRRSSVSRVHQEACCAMQEWLQRLLSGGGATIAPEWGLSSPRCRRLLISGARRAVIARAKPTTSAAASQGEVTRLETTALEWNRMAP